MSTTQDLVFEDHRHALVATVCCERMDYMIIDTLKRRITAQATMSAKFNIILDLSHVGMIPSMIMGEMIRMLKDLQRDGRQFVLVGMNRHIRASFRLMRIDQLFSIRASLDEALQAVSPRNWG